MNEVHDGVANSRVRQAPLFPCDDVSVPFSTGLRMHLVPGNAPAVVNST